MKELLLTGICCLTTLCISAQSVQDSIQIMQAHWEVTLLQRGLVLRHASFQNLYGGPQQVYILEVNPRKHPLHVLVHQGRELTSQKAAQSGAVGAVNGTYFDMGETARSVCYTAENGVVTDFTKSDLGLLSDGALFICKKRVWIAPWSVQQERTFRPGKKDVMVCGPLMVLDGKEVDLGPDPGSHIPKPNPRSGIVVKNRRKVFLVVVDGRQPGSAIGVTIPQFAHLSRVLGGRQALNLDGGGSSVLWTQEQGIANKPSDGKERTVSNSVIVD